MPLLEAAMTDMHQHLAALQERLEELRKVFDDECNGMGTWWLGAIIEELARQLRSQ